MGPNGLLLAAVTLLLAGIPACRPGPATPRPDPGRVTVAARSTSPAQAATSPVPPQLEVTPAPTVGGESVAAATPTPTAPRSSPTPTVSPTPVPSPTAHTPPLPIPTPSGPPVEYHLIQAGETLSYLASLYDVDLETLLAFNALPDESVIIHAGQTLRVPVETDLVVPKLALLPDSEVVFGPGYRNFDVAAFIRRREGYLANYVELVNGVERTGAEIVERIAIQYSVGPRVLLALIEFYGGWLDDPAPPPERLARPLGPGNPRGGSLYQQLAWTANALNEGYYGYKRHGTLALTFRDRSRARVPWGLNAGTVGIQDVLARNADWQTWQEQIEPSGFVQTYRHLFGDPFIPAVEPLLPFDLTQPALRLPWEDGTTFYFTGGPHSAYGEGSAWAAVDFGPPDVLGSCFYSGEFTTAAAAGTIMFAEEGQILLDLDGDGSVTSGWVLLYLHLAFDETEIQIGQQVPAGTPLGHASCEGGVSNASHVHFARRYNGEWISADGPVPMLLGGWRVQAGIGPYDGTMVRRDQVKSACECWDEVVNALTAP